MRDLFNPEQAGHTPAPPMFHPAVEERKQKSFEEVLEDLTHLVELMRAEILDSQTKKLKKDVQLRDVAETIKMTKELLLMAAKLQEQLVQSKSISVLTTALREALKGIDVEQRSHFLEIFDRQVELLTEQELAA